MNGAVAVATSLPLLPLVGDDLEVLEVEAVLGQLGEGARQRLGRGQLGVVHRVLEGVEEDDLHVAVRDTAVPQQEALPGAPHVAGVLQPLDQGGVHLVALGRGVRHDLHERHLAPLLVRRGEV